MLPQNKKDFTGGKKSSMVRYIKCPRCELNYIDVDKQEYCDVCIAEIKGNKLKFADLEDEELNEELEAEASELCSVCGINRVRYGETVCESCRNKSEYEEEETADPEQDDEWKNYLDEDDAEDLTVDDEELEEELKEELDGEDEELEEENEDDFFDDVDSLSDLEDEEYDEDEDDEDEDDDLF